MGSLFFFLLSVTLSSLALSEGGSIGVNYGRVANNLPSAAKVIQLAKSYNLDRIKVYDTDSTVMKALSGSGIKVVVDLPNELLSATATRPNFAVSWVERNIRAYYPGTQIEAIAVGNEVFVDPKNATKFLVPAMRNIHEALSKHNLAEQIKVSSPIALSALGSSYPPSAGSFKQELVDVAIKPMLELIRETGSYIMVNAYPFFAYESNSDVIPLDYALFRQNSGVVDPKTGYRYYNLFDAQIDAVFAALSALKYDDINVVVTETGWPSKGDSDETGASIPNAAAYNGNLIRRVLLNGGTPLRPKADLRVYLFAMFNENQKNGPTSERNYGLFYPTQKRVYDVPFTTADLKYYTDSTPPSPTAGASGGGTWCVAVSQAGKEKLQAALDYACGEGEADCRPIQPGSTCYNPNTVAAHASYAFNSYYQKNKRKTGTCFFGGAAYVVTQRPKFGACAFPTGV